MGIEENLMLPAILDTDIGTDVDDAVALSLCLRSPEIDLVGITTVYGDTNLRAGIALKLLQLAGRKDISVAVGIKKPLLREREVWWAGHEGEGILTPEDKQLTPIPQSAVDFINERVLAQPEEITLITIGPLTNIATAIIKEPKIISAIKKMIIMGGVVRLGDNAWELPFVEHNIKSDPEAARIVFNSGIPITLVPLDVTMKAPLHRQDIDRLTRVNTPLTNALVILINRWLKFINRDYCHLHDPLAVATAFKPELVTTRPVKILLENRGEYTTGMTIALPVKKEETGVEVCVNVNAPGFLDFLLQRLCSA